MVEQLESLTAEERSLFPSSLTIRALRDSRYHNSAYAIAELIDNSIQAEAEHVELLCMERAEMRKERNTRQVEEIAVLDNGTGMSFRTLYEAMKFGGGTRHYSETGIGKYGMGLPTASISQCKKVDVWTWQNGIDSALHSCIDINVVEQGNYDAPVPDNETPIPNVWRNAGPDEIFSNHSGTLVVWSQLDKIQWKTGRAVIDNANREIGRIHRHFLNADIVRVNAKCFLRNRPSEPEYPLSFVANDPLYLMQSTSTPAPWDEEAMFVQWGPTQPYRVTVEGKESTIEVKYSIVKPEALRTDRVTQNPGTLLHGRHARHNIGVSVVREDREIVLEDAFLREGGSDENPQNRWWGCEVHFRRECDDLFGVDHNKQMVANFSQAAKTLARDDRANQVILDEMGIEGDIIYDIVGDIRDQTRSMMRQIKNMFSQRRKKPGESTRTSTPESKAAETATAADQDAIAADLEAPTSTDADRAEIPSGDRVVGLTEQFIEMGQNAEDAHQLARMLVDEGISYQFNAVQLDAFQIFNVRSSQGVLHINLNTEHPVYDLLKHIEGVLGEDADESDPIFQASVAIRLLLSAWARMEDHTESREERAQIQHIAMNWGRQVAKVISQLREREE